MNYDIVKYERGQVWMIRFKNKNEQVGHEQQKDRPWLILSIGKFNKSSGMVTAAPITTRDNERSPSQVRFLNDKNIYNVILCENIRTFDYTSGAYIFDYLGTVSDDILEKVDVALSVHLGMHYSPITLNKLYDSMEAIIKSVGYMQEKAGTEKFTDQDVSDFADKLISITPSLKPITSLSSVEIAEPLDLPKMECIEMDASTMFNGPSLMKPYYVTPSKDEEGKTVHTICEKVPEEDLYKPEKKAPRMKWTIDKCKEFINDTETLPMKKVMEKWDISKKSKYYSMKSYAQNLLMKMTKS